MGMSSVGSTSRLGASASWPANQAQVRRTALVFRKPRIVAARDGGKQRLVARGEHRREVRRCEGAVAVHVHVFKGGLPSAGRMP